MAMRKIFNNRPRNFHLSARGASVVLPRMAMVEIPSPGGGSRSGPKRGEVMVDEDFLGALGEDAIVRSWVTEGDIDINGPWPKAPPKPPETMPMASAIDNERRVKTAEQQIASLETRLAAAAQVNELLKADLEKLRAEHARLLEAATAPAGGGKSKASAPQGG